MHERVLTGVAKAWLWLLVSIALIVIACLKLRTALPVWDLLGLATGCALFVLRMARWLAAQRPTLDRIEAERIAYQRKVDHGQTPEGLP